MRLTGVWRSRKISHTDVVLRLGFESKAISEHKLVIKLDSQSFEARKAPQLSYKFFNAVWNKIEFLVRQSVNKIDQRMETLQGFSH